MKRLLLILLLLLVGFSVQAEEMDVWKCKEKKDEMTGGVKALTIQALGTVPGLFVVSMVRKSANNCSLMLSFENELSWVRTRVKGVFY